ncbi:MAG: hypothetical protein NTW52_13110 [Planctomycetota bacterium]|nr:hypothetical protein [Planctomycetota bacterium]
MSFVRNDRSDRRRRVIRESAAADSELAVESVRARKRQRIADRAEEDDSTIPIRRDPGYSQAVRRACQQRLVQLIPVRRSSLTLVLLTAWSIWAALLLAHYVIHVRPLSLLQSGVAQPQPSPPLPISYLLHLRSSHGIAHWLGSQLWMLTALSALMIFQLKRHKLDDYRAKYRVWATLSIAALFSSMDASTSALLLLGKSIDTWALREVGYSGWSLVLASFATVVAMLGIRLCNELKSAPASLVFWLGGLLAWATSAVIGTGLLKTDWSQAQTDMIVGAAWLGGILAVFVSSGIYLRHIYIQAQRRFVMRNGMIREGQKWRMPNLSLRRKPSEEGMETESVSDEKVTRRQTASSDRTAVAATTTIEAAPQANRSSSSSRNQTSEQDSKSESTSSEPSPSKARRLPRIPFPALKMPSLRLPKWHSEPKLGADYSDVDAEKRLRDEGFDAPMPKKPSWFSNSKTGEPQSKSVDATTNNSQQKSESKSEARSTATQSSASRESNADIPDFNEVATDKKSWWSLSRKDESPKPAKVSSQEANSVTSNNVNAKSTSSSSANNSPATATSANAAKPKKWWGSKSWGLLPKLRTASSSPETSVKTQAEKPAQKAKKKWFGLLDGLKLKPPSESMANTINNSSGNANKSQGSSPSSKPIGPPSSSSAARYDAPTQAKSSTPIQVNRTPTVEPDEEEDDQSNRGMSRAERKRLRKQQQENRKAA